MYLLVDNSWSDRVVLHYAKATAKGQKSLERSAGGLLQAIDSFLKEWHLDITDLAGMAILVGQGRFTSTRVAVTITNTLAYVQHIPVLAVKEIIDFDWVDTLKKVTPGNFISAEYSSEPRVGKKI